MRVAVVRFGDAADVPIGFGQFVDKTSLRTAISGIGYVSSNSSALSAALDVVRTAVFNASLAARSGAARVVVLVTSRVPVDSYQQLASSVSGVQSAGIRLVSVVVFQSGRTLANGTQQLLSYYYDMIVVDDTGELNAVVNQTTVYACPLQGIPAF